MNKKRKKHVPLPLALLTLFILLSSITIMLLSQESSNDLSNFKAISSISSNSPLTTNKDQKIGFVKITKRSKEDQKKFWASKMEPLMKPIFTRTHRLEEVNQFMGKMSKGTIAQYGKKVIIVIEFKYNPSPVQSTSGHSFAGARVVDGIPNLIVYVPELMDFWDRLVAKGIDELQCYQMFECRITIVMTHEISHFGLGHVSSTKPTDKAMSQAESEAWTLGCQDIFPRFVEMYGDDSILGSDIVPIYRLWIASERDENSEVWRKGIKKLLN
jgi:hypothetical protein